MICSGDSVQIGGPVHEGSSYSWVSLPAGFVSTSASSIVKPLQTTGYILTETIVSTVCASSDSVKITTNQLPIPLIDGPVAVCIGSKVIDGTRGKASDVEG